MLSAVQIVVEVPITCVCHRIPGIKCIFFMKSLHKRLKTVGICHVLKNIIHHNISVTDSHLDIVGRQQLVVTHIVLLYPHKGRVVVGLGIAVALFFANIHTLTVLRQLLSAFIYPLIQPLHEVHCGKIGRVQKLLQNEFQIGQLATDEKSNNNCGTGTAQYA